MPPFFVVNHTVQIFIILLGICLIPRIVSAQHQPEFEVDSNGYLWIDHQKVSIESTEISYWIELFGETPHRIPEQKRTHPGHFRPAYYIFDSAGVVINFMVQSDSGELITNLIFNLSRQSYYQPKFIYTDTIWVMGIPVDVNSRYKDLQSMTPIELAAAKRKNGKRTTYSIRLFWGERHVSLRQDKQTGKISEIWYREHGSWPVNPEFNQ